MLQYELIPSQFGYSTHFFNQKNLIQKQSLSKNIFQNSKISILKKSTRSISQEYIILLLSIKKKVLEKQENDIDERYSLFLFLWFWWWKILECELYHFCHFFSIFQPIRIDWCSISRSWICFGFCILEEMECFWSCLEKESIIANESKNSSLTIYTIFSHHWFKSNIWNE